MISDSEIIYEPTERQEFFHACSDDYIVLGGSRGSGKSLCLIVEALGISYGSHIKGNWHALIIRRTVPQLQELLSRAVIMYPKIVNGIKYNAQKSIFTFPNGSYVRFASCEHDDEIEKYRGHEYNFIAIDEGSHFDNDYVWNWLKSCNRNSYGYPNRMVLTSNPCLWIKKLCGVDDYGHDTLKTIIYKDEKTGEEVIKTLRFIQMNLETNPHLSSDYKASLYQDELHRDQFLYGLWKTPPVPGQVLKAELERFHAEQRLMPLVRDPELPVHVFTDIGFSDFTSLIFCQFVGDRINILNYFENSQTSVDEYIAVCNKLYGSKALVHLPHDGAVHESNARTRRQYWSDRIAVAKDTGAGGNLSRLSDEEAWHRVQAGFGRIYMDTNESCLVLLDHLTQYHRKFVETLGIYTDPVHDMHSHAFDATKYIFYAERPRSNTSWAAYKPNHQSIY